MPLRALEPKSRASANSATFGVVLDDFEASTRGGSERKGRMLR